MKVIVSDGKAYVTDERWITIGGEDNDGSGQHVLIKENGTIVAGFGKGKNVRNAFGGDKPKKADSPEKANAAIKAKTNSSKYEDEAKKSVEYWVQTHYKNPSDKNIKESVDNVRSQMEHRLKTAERNLNDAKKTGKPELIKTYQDKYDEAKGMLDGLNKYYDGGTVKKADTPEKANEAVKQKAFKEATARVTERRSKEESAKIERAKETLKDIDKRITEAKKAGDDKRVSFLEATKNRAQDIERRNAKSLSKMGITKRDESEMRSALANGSPFYRQAVWNDLKTRFKLTDEQANSVINKLSGKR